MNKKEIEVRLPELLQLEALKKKYPKSADFKTLATIETKWGQLPIYQIKIRTDNASPQKPVLFLVGGVHGLERIGTRVIISLLEMILERMQWDEGMYHNLSNINLVTVPLLNPGGMAQNSRGNTNGVDLMRNAPVEAEDPPFLIGGHRISPKLMWYRGRGMELEARALCDTVRAEAFDTPFSLAVDFHSGFGIQDQIWFPYGKTKKPFPNLPEAFALKNLIDKNHPQHFYKIEPQALNYVIHGDLWDYLYDDPERSNLFLPLTLEMGSWLWIKKNPKQIFGMQGFFNPIKQHRLKRILRRHWILFDLLISATVYWQKWAKLDSPQKTQFETEARKLWYA